MKIKSFIVEAVKVNGSGKKSLAQVVDETINNFVSETGAEIVSVNPVIEFSIQDFGKAFISVLYNEPLQKKEINKK